MKLFQNQAENHGGSEFLWIIELEVPLAEDLGSSQAHDLFLRGHYSPNRATACCDSSAASSGRVSETDFAINSGH